MYNLNAKPSEVAGIVGVIDPDALAASTVTSAWISAKNFTSFMTIVQAGDLGAAATVDAKLQQATSGAGAGAKDITGKLITQLTQAGTDSDKQVIINLRPEELDVKNDFAFFRLSLTVAVAASEVSAVILGMFPARGPATGVDLATVDEIVG